MQRTGGGDASRSLLSGVYALVDPRRPNPLTYLDGLLAGGIRLVQIRAKDGVARDALAAMVERVHGRGGIVLVNDDVGLALGADGVHLGQDDAATLDLRAVRAALGGRVIGLSCGTPAEAHACDPAIVDYIGVGPMFATRSKADAGGPIGVNGVKAVVAASRVPAAAIGGIDLASIPRVRETGAAMAAIISALAEAADVEATAREFVRAWSA